MDKKEFFLKDAGIISKELETKIEKSELHAVKKKEEIDEAIENLKQKKVDFDIDLEKLKTVPDDKFEVEMNEFKKKYNTESIVEELDQKFTEFADKTKTFFSDMGNKVSGFYHKQMEKKDKPEEL
ncbi:MAG: hypothetical protein K8R54_19130 [Bacteroidales bacterium]|nr:hypothetical protein [Bacteroidales bacterium]